MRKLLIVPAVMLFAGTAAPESRFFLSLGANITRPADSNFRLVYGGHAIYPDVAAAVRLIKGLCLTVGAGRFSKTGTTPELGLEARGTQSYLSFGLGYILRASRTLCFEAGAGIAGLSYEEETMGAWVRGRRRGVSAEGGLLLLPETERFFFGLKAGYMYARASDLSPDLAGLQPVRLGGARISLCVGIQLFGDN